MGNTTNNIFNNLLIVNSNTTTSACLWNNQPNTSAAPTLAKLNSNNNIYSINKKNRNFLFVQGDITSLNLVAFTNCDTCAALGGVVSPYSVLYDPAFNINCSTYKTYIKSSGNRELGTFYENISFAGGSNYPANLQPNPSGVTYAQNSGVAQGYATDILGNAVNSTTPDVGAIEFTGGTAIAGAGSPLANNYGAGNTGSGDATTPVKLYNPDCELMAQVSPSGVSQVAGIVNAQVWIDNTNGNYTKRHTQITPVNNATTATATVTLYYTQQEFLDFNAANPSALPMPTSSLDVASIPNLRVQKLSGVSSNGSGTPNSYPSSVPVTIVPSSVTWNADSVYWAVTFDVAGFSGFFLNTNPLSTPLPVNFKSFNAFAASEWNELAWTMGNVNEKGSFEVMHSLDGSTFETIGTVASNNNGSYTFKHTTPTALEIYRIKFTDASGKAYYSNTQMVQRKDKSNLAVLLYPNPVSQNTSLKVNVMNPSVAGVSYSITDVLGKTVSGGTIETTGNSSITVQIDITSLAAGVYNFKLLSGNDEIIRKLIIGR
jgi:hypothetical protein